MGRTPGPPRPSPAPGLTGLSHVSFTEHRADHDATLVNTTLALSEETLGGGTPVCCAPHTWGPAGAAESGVSKGPPQARGAGLGEPGDTGSRAPGAGRAQTGELGAGGRSGPGAEDGAGRSRWHRSPLPEPASGPRASRPPLPRPSRLRPPHPPHTLNPSVPHKPPLWVSHS